MPNLYPVIINATLGLIVICGVLLLIIEFRRSNKINQILEEKANQLILDAVKRSQEVVATSEEEALKMTSDSKFFKEKYEQDMAQKITQSISNYELSYQKSMEDIRMKLEHNTIEFNEYLKYLKNESDKSRNESLQLIKSEITGIFEKIEQDLADFLQETQQHSVEAVDQEVKATRTLIDEYKTSQLKLIDENIIAVLERTLSLVLVKKLSLKDQSDIIFESLEKAKAEKFIV